MSIFKMQETWAWECKFILIADPDKVVQAQLSKNNQQGKIPSNQQCSMSPSEETDVFYILNSPGYKLGVFGLFTSLLYHWR